MKYFKLKTNNKGFTMIELIIVIVIMSVAIGTLMTVVQNVVRSTLVPEITNTATHLAEQELERVSVLRFSNVANEASAAFAVPYADYSRQIIVSAVPGAIASDPGMAQYKQVVVRVNHATIGNVDLTTIVTNN